MEKRKMKKQSIDWLVNPDGTPGKSWNPVFGCNGKCVYCYARQFAKRFGMAERMAKCEMKFKYGKKWENDISLVGIDGPYEKLKNNFKNFIPTFRPSVLAQKLPKKPTMIFFSMSDPEYWQKEWYEKILEKICQHMQHTFVILTKSPKIYRSLHFPHNCWLGVTVENQKQLNNTSSFITILNQHNTVFLSIEPIQEFIKIPQTMQYYLDWVIVDPETGNRKDRVIAKPEWLEYFYNLPGRVFMKEACRGIVGDNMMRQEMPEGYMGE